MSSRLASNGTRVVQSDRSSDGSTLQPLEAAARTAERIQRTHRLHAPEADTGFRLNLTVEEVPTVGPGSYDPRMTLTASASPRADFGLAHRFLPSKVGYISPRHNSDLLCTASPGPKYHVVPTAATYPRPPALGWGEKLSAEQREKKAALIAASNDATDVGPAAYTPRVANIKPTAPRCAFSRSSRFGGPFGSYQVLNNSSSADATSGGGSLYASNIDATVPSSPRFSFAATQHGENGRDAKHKPRTSFMTHSIRGGLAKPATLECNIGPGDYSPRTGDIGSNTTVRSGFGTSTRFLKAGLQYISHEHAKTNVGQAGPGPKYLLSNGDTAANSDRTPRTSALKWIP